MEVKLKLESRHWLKLLALLKKASYIYDVEVVQTDMSDQFNINLDNVNEDEDYTVLPLEREALLHLSDWDEDSLQKVEQAHSSFNQLASKSW